METIYHSHRHIGKTVWRSALRNFVFRNRPFFAHLVLTKRCNLRCVYCKAWQQPPNPNELSTSEWFEAMDVLDRLGVYVLSFTGGEPLLKPGVFDMIRYARSRGFYTRLTSNGTLPQHFYEKLIGSGIDGISISLDSVDPETQENLSQVKGSWRKAIHTLEFLVTEADRNQMVSVSTVVTPHNINEIIPIVDFCSNVLQCPVFLQPVISGEICGGTPAFRPTDSDMFRCNPKDIKELYRKLHRKLFSSKLLTSYTFLQISQEYLQTGEYKWKCKAGGLFFDIMPDGEFYLCQDVPFTEKRHILDNDFVSWFRSKSQRETVKQLRADCSGCCYSCYIYAQYLFSWRLPDILAVAIMNSRLRRPITPSQLTQGQTQDSFIDGKSPVELILGR
jgi:MoaA/NifB/PqqE/SkfB family radical SAM enzyme